jgi:hypothetical protein
MAEAVELGKDVPHPVRPLAPGPHFGQSLVIVVGLGLDKTDQVVGIVRHDISSAMWRGESDRSISAAPPSGGNECWLASWTRKVFPEIWAMIVFVSRALSRSF